MTPRALLIPEDVECSKEVGKVERGRKRTAAVSQWDARQAPPTPNISCHVFPQPLLENVSLKPVVERVKKERKSCVMKN